MPSEHKRRLSRCSPAFRYKINMNSVIKKIANNVFLFAIEAPLLKIAIVDLSIKKKKKVHIRNWFGITLSVLVQSSLNVDAEKKFAFHFWLHSL